ncbi:Six-hairpin glycosidase-like protein [Aspergillus californicus]
MGSVATSPTDQGVIREIFSENVFAKVLRVAEDALENNTPPTAYPEFVPQTGHDAGQYFLREADFWTCGFFPGILYQLRERAIKYPQVFPYLGHEHKPLSVSTLSLRQHLSSLCRDWTSPVQAMMTRTDTHDMAFILEPSLRRDWELTSNEKSLQALLTGAHSLATRYVPSVGAIRSWDALIQSDVCITSLDNDCVVIIDSMMNLSLLYYASAHLSDPALADMATTHARTVTKSLLRPECVPGRKDTRCPYPLYSSYHVVNFDPHTGGVKQQRTAQGYRAESTWARGQAWGIMGYAQTYSWTKEREFLAVACGLAEYFLYRLETAPACVEKQAGGGSSDSQRTIGRYVPLWDFDAPIEDENNPLRDTSAGVIAANGMLLISQYLTALGDEVLARRYYDAAMKIVMETIEYSLSQEKARILPAGIPEETTTVKAGTGVKFEDVIPGQRFDAILKNATANHNAKEYTRYSDHGLVYGDYFLLEFGNQLLRMGFV